jgi:hypothetical protein
MTMHFVRASALAAIAVASLTTAASALDRRVQINNLTSFDIYEFYASNVDAKTWEEDILGKDILPAGKSVVINIDDGSGYCLFDFKAVFSDGEEVVSADNNVCELSEFNFTE